MAQDFNTQVSCVFPKFVTFKASSDVEDNCEEIHLGWSTRDKYKVKKSDGRWIVQVRNNSAEGKKFKGEYMRSTHKVSLSANDLIDCQQYITKHECQVHRSNCLGFIVNVEELKQNRAQRQEYYLKRQQERDLAEEETKFKAAIAEQQLTRAQQRMQREVIIWTMLKGYNDKIANFSRSGKILALKYCRKVANEAGNFLNRFVNTIMKTDEVKKKLAHIEKLDSRRSPDTGVIKFEKEQGPCFVGNALEKETSVAALEKKEKELKAKSDVKSGSGSKRRSEKIVLEGEDTAGELRESLQKQATRNLLLTEEEDLNQDVALDQEEEEEVNLDKPPSKVMIRRTIFMISRRVRQMRINNKKFNGKVNLTNDIITARNRDLDLLVAWYPTFMSKCSAHIGDQIRGKLSKLIEDETNLFESLVRLFLDTQPYNHLLLSKLKKTKWVKYTLLGDIVQLAYGSQLAKELLIRNLIETIEKTDVKDDFLFCLGSVQQDKHLDVDALQDILVYSKVIGYEILLESRDKNAWLFHIRKKWLEQSSFIFKGKEEYIDQVASIRWSSELTQTFFLVMESKWLAHKDAETFLTLAASLPSFNERNVLKKIHSVHEYENEEHPEKWLQQYFMSFCILIVVDFYVAQIENIGTYKDHAILRQEMTLLLGKEMDNTFLFNFFCGSVIDVDKDVNSLREMNKVLTLANDLKATILDIKQVHKRNPDLETIRMALHSHVMSNEFSYPNDHTDEEIWRYVRQHIYATKDMTAKVIIDRLRKIFLDVIRQAETIEKRGEFAGQVFLKSYLKRREEEQNIPFAEEIAVFYKAVQLATNYTPRDVQLIAFIISVSLIEENFGGLGEMKTGEGKSMVLMMIAAYLGTRKNFSSVDIVTTSKELVTDFVSNQQISRYFGYFGLTMGDNVLPSSRLEIEQIYQRNIVVGTAESFQADYQRHFFMKQQIRGNRKFGFIIVDEVDSMLFDQRTHTVRLSSPTPLMDELALPLVIIWSYVDAALKALEEQNENRLQVMFNQVESSAITFFKELFSGKHKNIAPKKDKKSNRLRRVVSRKNEISTRVKKRKLPKISEKSTSVERDFFYTSMEIPVHLEEYCQRQKTIWIKNALYARLYYKRDKHYYVSEAGTIVPIDHEDTGEFLKNTVWENGLAQFMQLKENLPLLPCSVSTNYISKPAFYKKYATNIIGFTGTLGDPQTQWFLKKKYNLRTFRIPRFKKGRSASGRAYKKYLPRICHTRDDWKEKILTSSRFEAIQGRVVLVICEYVANVNEFYSLLALNGEINVVSYIGQSRVQKIGGATEDGSIPARTVILATNIAGRGTDLKISSESEEVGGLHVCLTFLPKNRRVENQNMGRTGRAGNKGSTQLIVFEPNTSLSIKNLKQKRDEENARHIAAASKEFRLTASRDKLFNQYNSVEERLLPSMGTIKKNKRLEDLGKKFNYVFDNQLKNFEKEFEAMLKEEAKKAYIENKRDLDDEPSEQQVSETVEVCLTSESVLKEVIKVLRINFVENYKDHVPPDVWYAFVNQEGLEGLESGGEDFDPMYVDINVKAGIQERWGIWLKLKTNERLFENLEQQAEEDILEEFTAFKKSLRQDFDEDKAISNPVFLIRKGIEKLTENDLLQAENFFTQAINMDANFAVFGLYYRSYCKLFSSNEGFQDLDRALVDFSRTQELLQDVYIRRLVTLGVLVSLAAGNVETQTCAHLQRKLTIFTTFLEHVNDNIAVIGRAKQNDWRLRIEPGSIKQVCHYLQENHDEVIEEVRTNGLDKLFYLVREDEAKQKYGDVMASSLLDCANVMARISMGAIDIEGKGLRSMKNEVASATARFLSDTKRELNLKKAWEAWGIEECINSAVVIRASVIHGAREAVKKSKLMKNSKGITSLEERFSNAFGLLYVNAHEFLLNSAQHLMNPIIPRLIKHLQTFLIPMLRSIFLPMIIENTLIRTMFARDFWLNGKSKKEKTWGNLLRDFTVHQVDEKYIFYLVDQSSKIIDSLKNMKRMRYQEDFFNTASTRFRRQECTKMCASIVDDTIDRLLQTLGRTHEREGRLMGRRKKKKARSLEILEVKADAAILKDQKNFAKWISKFVARTVQHSIHGNVSEVIHNSITHSKVTARDQEVRKDEPLEPVLKIKDYYRLIKQASAAFRTSIVVYSENCIQVKAFNEGAHRKKIFIENWQDGWRVVSELEAVFRPLNVALAKEFGVSVKNFMDRCREHENAFEEDKLDVIWALMNCRCISKFSVQLLCKIRQEREKAEAKYLKDFKRYLENQDNSRNVNEEALVGQRAGSMFLLTQKFKGVEIEIERSRRERNHEEVHEEQEDELWTW